MASYGIQVQMYIDDEPTGRIFNHWTTSSTITAQTLVSAAPSSWRKNYDFEGIRNYSSWITYSRGVFTGLSSSKTNYINFSYSEKTVSYWTWRVYYRGNPHRCGARYERVHPSGWSSHLHLRAGRLRRCLLSYLDA